MELNEFIVKDGLKLRLGYTTGSCAAAAAKAAAQMLLTGSTVSQVRLQTPKGLYLILDIEEIRFQDGKSVSCAVRKDGGDDPDITDGALICAEVSLSDTPGIRIDGGEGVGRVTRPGLDQPVGNAAINSTPRRMIREAVLDVLRSARKRPAGLNVIIFVPQGRELAARTFNPKLGIVGGISILGTSGIVEPMSDQALLDTIQVQIRVLREEGLTFLPAAPGNYGKMFFRGKYGFSLSTAVTTSNFVYDTVRMTAEAGFKQMLFVGHIGKLVKVAGGIRNTHSHFGDHRMEILLDIAKNVLERNGAGEGVYDRLRRELEDCVMTDEAVNILHKYGLDKVVLAEMTCRIQKVMQGWAGGKIQVEVIVFSNAHGELGRTKKALEYVRVLREQVSKI